MNTPKTVQRACRLLKERVRYQRAALKDPDSKSLVDFTSDRAFTDKVIRGTERYCESWILPIIDAIEKGDLKLLQQVID